MAYSAPSPCYLIDFSVYKPPEEWIIDAQATYDNSLLTNADWNEETREFGNKVFERSGISRLGTYLPPWLDPGQSHEMKFDMKTAMKEAELTMGETVADLLAKTGVTPQDVDILVTNCSIFCPTPSLSSMLINKFKFRPDVQCYNLGGMGCANGVIAIGLIKDLLVARPKALALFVPSEICTYALYPGNKKEFMVANVLFRMGGAAILLANKHRLAAKAKYSLLYNTRVHTGQDDEAYGCMGFGPDENLVNGVWLDKSVPKHAATALGVCLRYLGPRVMTWTQYLEAAVHVVGKQLSNVWTNPFDSVRSYQPKFGESFDHFALHAGGYMVVKALQKALNLSTDQVMPSFATLCNFGNTSCSTTWYVMAYIESIPGGVKKGEKIMQVGLGGGMKAGVNVWRALRSSNDVHPAWERVAEKPMSPADLPRPIDEVKPADKAANGVVANGFNGH